MENDLSKIYNWLFQNKLSLNIVKTKFISFGNKIDSVPTDINIYINEHRIERVNNFKYPGVTFDFDMKFKIHIGNIIKRLRYLLYAFSKLRCTLNLKELLTLYYGLFHSTASYGIIAWGCTNKSEIDKINNL